jgi:hypothetical protein
LTFAFSATGSRQTPMKMAARVNEQPLVTACHLVMEENTMAEVHSTCRPKQRHQQSAKPSSDFAHRR